MPTDVMGATWGVFGQSKAPIVERMALVDGEKGIEIYDALKPLPHEEVLKKRRFSAFYRGPTSTSSPAAPGWKR